ncbi:hypothetical protein ACQ3G7_17300 [Kosakonia oryzendophytica]|uniref:hypothetical protein n=1 Tax=Kosakonia oryzendophytica TaxID=1005665 RepID=UPI003D346094
MSETGRDIESEEKIIRENMFVLESNAQLLSNEEYNNLRQLILRGRIEEFKYSLFDIIARNSPEKLINDDITAKRTGLGSNYFNFTDLAKSQIQSLTSKLIENEEKLKTQENINSKIKTELIQKNRELEQVIIKSTNLETSNKELQSLVQQKRIDEKIPGYVDNVKSELSSDDAHFILMSKIWAGSGAFFGMLAVLASFYSLYFKIDFNEAKGFELFYLFTRGLIGISILSWLSYICLSNSKKYTHESIRRKDRRHALMFGQVFLQIYGSTATKEDAILVFKDWNMSGDSAFSDQTDQPPGIYALWDTAKEKLKSSINEKTTE